MTVSSSKTSTLQSLYQSPSVMNGAKSAGSSTASVSSSSTTATSLIPVTGISSSSSSGIPQAVITAITSYVAPTQQAWAALTQYLKSGDVSSAQTALSAYTTALSAATGTMATPSLAFSDDLTALGSSLKAGDLAAARTAFATATADRPNTAAEDVYWSRSQADLDGWITVYGLEHNAPTDQSVLASDISNVDDALREEGSYITAALVALGYNAATARSYGAEITGINLNESAQQNGEVDQARATQWVQGLTAITQGKVAPLGYSDLQPVSHDGEKDAVFNELSSILFSNAVNSGRLLQSLIDQTSSGDGTSTSNSSTQSPV